MSIVSAYFSAMLRLKACCPETRLFSPLYQLEMTDSRRSVPKKEHMAMAILAKA